MVLKSPIPIDQLKFNVPVPYKLHVDRELLDITKQKLALARYPEEQSDFNECNWSQGAKVSRVKQLAEHWHPWLAQTEDRNLHRGTDMREEELSRHLRIRVNLLLLHLPQYGLFLDLEELLRTVVFHLEYERVSKYFEERNARTIFPASSTIYSRD